MENANNIFEINQDSVLRTEGNGYGYEADYFLKRLVS